MKYFLESEDKKKILTYEYKAIKEKLYEYKKRSLEQKKNAISTIYGPQRYFFTLTDEYKKNNSLAPNIEVGESQDYEIDKFNKMVSQAKQYPIFMKHEPILLDKKRDQLVEKYAKGEIIFPERMRSYIYNGAIFFSDPMIVVNDGYGCGYNNYHIDGIFEISSDLVLLNALEEENWEKVWLYKNSIDEQFDCFEFNENPIESIDKETLKFLFKNNPNSMSYIIFTAKSNDEVLKLTNVKLNR